MNGKSSGQFTELYKILEEVSQSRPTKIFDRSFQEFGTLMAALLNVGCRYCLFNNGYCIRSAHIKLGFCSSSSEKSFLQRLLNHGGQHFFFNKFKGFKGFTPQIFKGFQGSEVDLYLFSRISRKSVDNRRKTEFQTLLLSSP